jgi:hypothetical protein
MCLSELEDGLVLQCQGMLDLIGYILRLERKAAKEDQVTLRGDLRVVIHQLDPLLGIALPLIRASRRHLHILRLNDPDLQDQIEDHRPNLPKPDNPNLKPLQCLLRLQVQICVDQEVVDSLLHDNLSHDLRGQVHFLYVLVGEERVDPLTVVYKGIAGQFEMLHISTKSVREEGPFDERVVNR